MRKPSKYFRVLIVFHCTGRWELMSDWFISCNFFLSLLMLGFNMIYPTTTVVLNLWIHCCHFDYFVHFQRCLVHSGIFSLSNKSYFQNSKKQALLVYTSPYRGNFFQQKMIPQKVRYRSSTASVLQKSTILSVNTEKWLQNIPEL